MIVKVALVRLMLDLLDVSLQLLRVARNLGNAVTFVDLHGSEHLVQVPAKQLAHQHVLLVELVLTQERKAVHEVGQVLKFHVECHYVSILDDTQPLSILHELLVVHLYKLTLEPRLRDDSMQTIVHLMQSGVREVIQRGEELLRVDLYVLLTRISHVVCQNLGTVLNLMRHFIDLFWHVHL